MNNLKLYSLYSINVSKAARISPVLVSFALMGCGLHNHESDSALKSCQDLGYELPTLEMAAEAETNPE